AVSMVLPLPFCLLFPYTTLFRSCRPWTRRPWPPRERLRFLPRPPAPLPLQAWSCRRRAGRRQGRGCLPAGTLVFVVDLLGAYNRSEEHTSELQSRENLVCRLLLE